MMDINIPEVVAEVEKAFARYERALVTNDIAELDASLTAGQAEVARLRKAEHDAEDADTAARQSVAVGPQRAPLELARERRGEWKRLHDRIPTLEAEASRLAARSVGQ